LAVPPRASFHTVQIAGSGRVEHLRSIDQAHIWINGGFFVLDQEIFTYLNEGEELVLQPFERLIAKGRLRCLKYGGFWSCMDTYKEKQQLDEMYVRGDRPWELWSNDRPRGAHTCRMPARFNGHHMALAK
jgi:glucose-1-phosphate cytidylyltransferase